jgi:hypothetical protein
MDLLYIIKKIDDGSGTLVYKYGDPKETKLEIYSFDTLPMSYTDLNFTGSIKGMYCSMFESQRSIKPNSN